jgi:hypothetical protein
MSAPLSALARHLLFGHFTAKGIEKGLSASLAEAPLSLERDEISAAMQSISWKAGEIMVSDQMRSIDPPSRGHLEWSAWILAAYRVLRPQFASEKEAIVYLEEASLRSFDTKLLRLGVALALRPIRGDLQKAKTILGAMITQNGASFESEFDATEGSIDFHIKQCFYFDFFNSHGVPELTTVLCRLDQLWFDRIDPAKHGISFDHDRYNTMNHGATECCFRIVKSSVSKAT